MGKPLSKEHRENISKGNKGKRFSDETKEKMSEAKRGKSNNWLGRKHSDESKKKMSEAHTGKPQSEEHRRKNSEVRQGEKNHMWRGGLTSEARKIRTSVAYEEWRKDVFNRDDYTCRECGKRGGNLNAHHVLSFYKYKPLSLNICNGITLCAECHVKYHKEEGYK